MHWESAKYVPAGHCTVGNTKRNKKSVHESHCIKNDTLDYAHSDF